MFDKHKRVHIQIKGSANDKKSKNEIAKKASLLGLKGYAKHEPGKVEIVAEGRREHLWELVKHCTVIKIKFREALFYFSDSKGNLGKFGLI